MDISADGTKLLLSEMSFAMGSEYAVALRGMDGSTPVKLGEGQARRLSPDGKWVLSTHPDAPNQITLLPTGAGAPRKISLDGFLILEVPPSFALDSKRIVVTIQEEGGTVQSYTVGLDGKETRPLLPVGHRHQGFSSDGQWILCYTGPLSMFDPDKVERHPRRGGEPRPVRGLRRDDKILQWTEDGSSLFVLSGMGFPARVFLLDVETGERVLWKELVPPERAGVWVESSIVVNPAGTAHAYSYVRWLPDLYVVEGLR